MRGIAEYRSGAYFTYVSIGTQALTKQFAKKKIVLAKRKVTPYDGDTYKHKGIDD